MIAPTLQELLATQGFLKDQVRTLTQERNCLPRNDINGDVDKCRNSLYVI